MAMTRPGIEANGVTPAGEPAADGVAAIVRRLHGSIESVRKAAKRISDNANMQANALREIVATAHSTSTDVGRISGRVSEAQASAHSAGASASETAGQVERLTAAVSQLATLTSSAATAVSDLMAIVGEIDELVDVVEDVSERTNLLALNASIEAARAGVHGRGFAVVASEIGKLADSTRSATQRVAKLVKEIHGRATVVGEIARQTDASVKSSDAAAHAASEALGSIVAAVAAVGTVLHEVESEMQAEAAKAEESGRAAQQVLSASRTHYADASRSALEVNALEFGTIEMLESMRGAQSRRAQGVLKVGAAQPRESIPGITFAHFAKLVAERSAGRLTVETIIPYPGRGEVQVLLDVRTGVLDFATVGTGIYGNVVPRALLLELPYLFANREEAHRFLEGRHGAAFLAEASTVGLSGLGFIENGMRHFTNNVRPLRRPEDLRDLRMRVVESPTHIAINEALNSIPTPIAVSKLFAALKNHEVDGQNQPLPNIAAMELQKVQKYLTLSAHTFTPTIVLGNPRAIEALGDDRELVLGALAEALVWHRGAAEQQARAALKVLREHMEVYDPAPADRAAFVDALRPVDDALADMVGRQAVDDIRDAARQALPT